MIIPEKHLSLSESILGLSAFVLSNLKKPKNLENLWIKYRNLHKNNKFKAVHTIENFVLSIDFLFIIGLIKIDPEGRLYSENFKVVSESTNFQNSLFQ
jgi:hypothetical protein